MLKMLKILFQEKATKSDYLFLVDMLKSISFAGFVAVFIESASSSSVGGISVSNLIFAIGFAVIAFGLNHSISK